MLRTGGGMSSSTGAGSSSADTSMHASDTEIESKLECIVVLFLYLQDKDQFIEIYRNQLAARLLKQRR